MLKITLTRYYNASAGADHNRMTLKTATRADIDSSTEAVEAAARSDPTAAADPNPFSASFQDAEPSQRDFILYGHFTPI
jgi:hypothetical protein